MFSRIQRSSSSLSTTSKHRTSFAMPIATPATKQQQQQRAISVSKSRAAPTKSDKPLYAQQPSLPHLPVPSLNSTFHKYLETIQPHVSTQSFDHNKTLVNKFLDSPLSSVLQARLEARASEKESWLSEWWNEAAYMGYRDSIVPNVNYYYLHKEGLAKGATQTRRAAEIIRGVGQFRELLVSERLEPEMIKGKALDSGSYPSLFNASRIPVKPADTFKIYDPSHNEHVIVLRKNRYFKVNAKGLSADQLDQAMQEVVSRADQAGEGLGIGSLTAHDRDSWTDAREHLISLSPKNAKAFEAIESSILLICLDDSAPAQGRDARSWNLYTGDGHPARNRWFDKHEFVVDANGESGFNGEHSMLDGTPTLRMNEFVLAALDKGKIPFELVEGERPGAVQVEEVEFVTDETVKQYVETAKNAFADVLKQHDLKVLNFDHYGKDAIKKHKVSPDAWVQMVKQLAYGKMTGKPAVTYESAQTRKFRLGRTEVIRASSNQSKAFVDAMLDRSQTDVERAKLFRNAAGRHIQYATWAADGQGVDRHMFGLKKLLRDGEDMPEVFRDEAFAYTSTWTFSTSNLTSEYLDNWGYGQVVAEGFGLSYSISDHYLRWAIMTTTGKADELKESITWAADELRRMMDSAARSGDEKAKL